MLKYLSFGLLALLSFLSAGCSKQNPNLPTVNFVDINKYIGVWYEIARFDHSFERGCKNVNAIYELKEDKIKVTNICTSVATNKTTNALGVAYATDETNSKLKVSFFRPFYGDYYILDVDEDYSYALVGTPNKKYLWILSRQKTMSDELKQKLVLKASSLGFETQKFIWTLQE